MGGRVRYETRGHLTNSASRAFWLDTAKSTGSSSAGFLSDMAMFHQLSTVRRAAAAASRSLLALPQSGRFSAVVNKLSVRGFWNS